MKVGKYLIWVTIALAAVALLVSCGYKQPGYTYPPLQTTTTLVPAIATTTVEVTGDVEKNEMLKVVFDRDSGELAGLVRNGKPIEITDENKDRLDEQYEFIHKREKTFYCVPPSAEHPANAEINGVEVYCGNVKFLTPGADIQFEAETASGNKKCKNVRGFVI
jgi:uncharacterized lipoprotein YajG